MLIKSLNKYYYVIDDRLFARYNFHKMTEGYVCIPISSNKPFFLPRSVYDDTGAGERLNIKIPLIELLYE